MLVTSFFEFLFYIFLKALKRKQIAERKMMDTTVFLAATPEKQSCTITPKVDVQWDSNTVYCGFMTAYKVIITGVTGEKRVNIFIRTDEGELLDEIELQMKSVIYVGKVLIPFNVAAGTTIYIETQLPEHGVVSKSECKPVYNSIPMPKRVSNSKTRSFPNVKGWAKRLLGIYPTQHHQSTTQAEPLSPLVSQVPHADRHFVKHQI